MIPAGRTFGWTASFFLALLCTIGQGFAGPIDGKKYIIQLPSGMVDSGYANYLVPPLAKVFDDAGFKAMRGPGAEIVVNITTNSDVGQWIQSSSGKEWMYTVTVMVGISPESYDIPNDGTPQFGASVSLLTPNGDRDDELACLITLAAKTAIAHYQPKGFYKASGHSCLRRQ